MAPMEEVPAATNQPTVKTSPHSCPIPLGWTVHIYRTKEVDGSEVWRGVGIRAEHECGRGLTLRLSEGPKPGPIEATLPNGDKALFTKVVKLDYDEKRWLRILWLSCLHRIHEWDLRYCREDGDCRCCQQAIEDTVDSSHSA